MLSEQKSKLLMSNIAIEFENISKRYRIGTLGTGSLRHDINRWWITKIIGKDDPYLEISETNDRSTPGTSKHVWALRDINLKVNHGEVLGIIGKNGAGKSTLLKLLSRVTSPTTGIIRAKGRIASLLEVGTGFHPEMTGKENIYMNGSIMGMTKLEIKRKIDDIVDFAGVEQYIDTPVKRYSSGMKVRLGFAVAAHMEPEILVVDEVLAVGDAEFQKKAIGKMQEVSKGHGRTVLFVSHNMASIKQLCSRGIILKDGLVEKSGDIQEIINAYLMINQDITIRNLLDRFEQKEAPIAYYTSIEVLNHKGNFTDTVLSGEKISIILNYKAKKRSLRLNFYIGLYNSSGEKLLHLGSIYSNHNVQNNKTSIEGKAICKFTKLPLPNGVYTLNLSLHHLNERVDIVHDAFKLQVESGDFYGTGKIPPTSVNKFLVEQEWQIK